MSGVHGRTRLTGPVKTVFDLDDQVPVSDVTLLRAFVKGARESTRRAREVVAGSNIVLPLLMYLFKRRLSL